MDFLHQIFGSDLQSAALIVLNLIVIESLLSVDNAAVLATMVMDLPKEQRNKALRYGIIGAYFFRGLCLVFASWLVAIWWLKPLGGLYLLWLTVDFFKNKLKYGEYGNISFKLISLGAFLYIVRADAIVNFFGYFEFNLFPLIQLGLGLYCVYLLYSLFKLKEDSEDDGEINKSNNVFYQFWLKKVGIFWSTVALVEVMDLAFSIDNVFAVVAFTDNIWMICIGVFIGILSMRFVAQGFVKLMEKFPFLEAIAFIVIGVLGVKLTISLVTHFQPESALSKFLDGETADVFISIFTVAIFVLPVLTSYLFDVPRKVKDESEKE
jgi:YkoY family integral membrane protein